MPLLPLTAGGDTLSRFRLCAQSVPNRRRYHHFALGTKALPHETMGQHEQLTQH